MKQPSIRQAAFSFAAPITLLLGFSSTASTAPVPEPAAPPTAEQMWRIIVEQRELIRQQNEKIDALTDRLGELEHKTDQNADAVAATADAIERTATSATNGWWERTTLGGYGEMHYSNLEGNGGASDVDEIDFTRFVLFFGHEFSDRVRFHSELELEHAVSGDDENGEVEIEQAFVDFDVNDRLTARAGLFLLPVGILNETHEPTTFYGVKRNPVERNIVPTTWWEGGAGVHGVLAPGWSYDAYLHSGLATGPGDDYRIRSGRQKVSEADASHWASTARLKWTGLPGLEVAGTLQYQDDITQGDDPSAGSAWLLESHASLQKGPFGLRALYARWQLDGAGPESLGADRQTGFYIEPSWRFNDRLGVFARYNQWDNRAGDSSDSEKEQWDVGFNWWPHPDVVIKADYQNQENEDGKDQDGFNLGIGYQF